VKDKTTGRRGATLGILMLFTLVQPGFTCGMECLYHAVPDGSGTHMVHMDPASCHGGAVNHVAAPSISIGFIPTHPGFSAPPDSEVDVRPPASASYLSFIADRETPPPRG
jgi:hypothetical protein